MKAIEHYFPVVLLGGSNFWVCRSEILNGDHIYGAVLSRGAVDYAVQDGSNC